MAVMAEASSNLLDGWIYRRQGGPQSQSGHDGEEKNLFPLPGIEPWFHIHSACSPLATMTKLTKANSN
jgi:hypothetical protein